MVFTWCPLGYKTVLANKADCREQPVGQLVSLLLSHSACAKGLIFCVTLLNSLGRLFLRGPKLEKSPVNEEGGIDRYRSRFFLQEFGTFLCLRLASWFPRKELGRCDELFLWTDRSLSIQRFLCLLIFKEMHILFALPLLVLCRLLPALQLCWSRGWLSPGEVVNCVISTNSCSISLSCRLRDNVKLIF